MPTTERLRLDGAIRTSKRKRDARSPQQQRDMIGSCAATFDYDVQTIHDSGRDESGKTMDRETLRAVMGRVERGDTDGLIVALADRLGRAPIEEAMAYVRRLTGVGKLVLADMGGVPLDLSDPASETNLVVQLQMARQYWLATANRFERSRADAIRAGRFIGPTPLGYERRDGRLHEHPEYGPIIRETYRTAATGGVYAALAHLQQRVPERPWNTTHVRRLLASRVYLGESRHGVYFNLRAHDPLTTLEHWTAAQTEPKGRRANTDYPLSGLVVCDTCRTGLKGQYQTTRDGTRRRAIRCANRDCVTGCSIGSDALEDHVRAWVQDNEHVLRVDYEVVGVDEARAELDRAEAERIRYAGDHEFHAAIGRAAALAGAHERTAAAESAAVAFRGLAAAAARTTRVPAAGELGDPEKFSRAVRWAIDGGLRISVRPGRRGRRPTPIGQRVVFDVLDGHDGMGVLAA